MLLRRPALLATLLMAAGCTLDTGGLRAEECVRSDDCPGDQVCQDQMCRPRVSDSGTDAGPKDAGPDTGRPDSGLDGGPMDSGFDAGPVDSGFDAGPMDAGFDAGPPAHCTDGRLSGDETDIDCGGRCSGCGGCRRCGHNRDCDAGACSGGVCSPVRRSVTVPGLGELDAFVREDGAILLAHYAPATYRTEYNPGIAQRTTTVGGGDPGARWAPTACTTSGHMAFGQVVPGGRAVTMECGTDYADIQFSVSSSSLFTDFTDGDKGTYGRTGRPGWGVVGSIDSDTGRYRLGACGTRTGNPHGGIAYCSGTSDADSSHLVSFYSGRTATSPIVGCNRTTCRGPSCDLHVWVWLEP